MSASSHSTFSKSTNGGRKRPRRMRVKKYNVDVSNSISSIDMAGRIEFGQDNSIASGSVDHSTMNNIAMIHLRSPGTPKKNSPNSKIGLASTGPDGDKTIEKSNSDTDNDDSDSRGSEGRPKPSAPSPASVDDGIIKNEDSDDPGSTHAQRSLSSRSTSESSLASPASSSSSSSSDYSTSKSASSLEEWRRESVHNDKGDSERPLIRPEYGFSDQLVKPRTSVPSAPSSPSSTSSVDEPSKYKFPSNIYRQKDSGENESSDKMDHQDDHSSRSSNDDSSKPSYDGSGDNKAQPTAADSSAKGGENLNENDNWTDSDRKDDIYDKYRDIYTPPKLEVNDDTPRSNEDTPRSNEEADFTPNWSSLEKNESENEDEDDNFITRARNKLKTPSKSNFRHSFEAKDVEGRVSPRTEPLKSNMQLSDDEGGRSQEEEITRARNKLRAPSKSNFRHSFGTKDVEGRALPRTEPLKPNMQLSDNEGGRSQEEEIARARNKLRAPSKSNFRHSFETKDVEGRALPCTEPLKPNMQLSDNQGGRSQEETSVNEQENTRIISRIDGDDSIGTGDEHMNDSQAIQSFRSMDREQRFQVWLEHGVYVPASGSDLRSESSQSESSPSSAVSTKEDEDSKKWWNLGSIFHRGEAEAASKEESRPSSLPKGDKTNPEQTEQTVDTQQESIDVENPGVSRVKPTRVEKDNDPVKSKDELNESSGGKVSHTPPFIAAAVGKDNDQSMSTKEEDRGNFYGTKEEMRATRGSFLDQVTSFSKTRLKKNPEKEDRRMDNRYGTKEEMRATRASFLDQVTSFSKTRLKKNPEPKITNDDDTNENSFKGGSLADQIAAAARSRKNNTSQLQSTGDNKKQNEPKKEVKPTGLSLADQIAAAARSRKNNTSQLRSTEDNKKLYEPKKEVTSTGGSLADQVAAAAKAVKLKNKSSPMTEEDYDKLYRRKKEVKSTEDSLADQVTAAVMAVKSKNQSAPKTEEDYDKLYDPRKSHSSADTSLADQVASASMAVKLKNRTAPLTEKDYNDLYKKPEREHKEPQLMVKLQSVENSRSKARRYFGHSSDSGSDDFEDLETNSSSLNKSDRELEESSIKSDRELESSNKSGREFESSNKSGRGLEENPDTSHSYPDTSHSDHDTSHSSPSPDHPPSIKSTTQRRKFQCGRFVGCILFFLIIIVLAALAVVLYYFVFRDNDKTATLPPSTAPTKQPVWPPSMLSTKQPVLPPTMTPTEQPVWPPSMIPTKQPVLPISITPTKQPVRPTSMTPTKQPVLSPTTTPTKQPVLPPTMIPTKQPVPPPTMTPTKQPVPPPTMTPTKQPVPPPTMTPTKQPVLPPSMIPTNKPVSNTEKPTIQKVTEKPQVDKSTFLQQLLVSRWPPLEQSLNILTSPQSEAFGWLVDENSEFDSYSDDQLVQRFVMATFFFSTNGNKWSNNEGWLSTENECQWYQTKSYRKNCDSSDSLINLELNENGLSGSVPSELAMLSNSLTRLDLSNDSNGTFLGGQLPSEIGLLTKLQYMSLSEQQLTGTLPYEIGQLSLLRVLDLESNKFEGSLMTDIGNLQELYNLYLGFNNFSGAISSAVGQLSFLINLDLRGNRFSSSLPSELGKLSYLQSLSLGGNKLTGTIPSFLGQLSNLRGSFDLSDNLLNGTIPTDLGQLSMLLTVLNLSSNKLLGPIPTELDQLTTLGNLQLQNNLLTGSIPPSFSELTQLQILQVQYNNLTGDVAASVCDALVTNKIDNKIVPTSLLADCEFKVDCECCQYCCAEGTGCECQFMNTDQDFLCRHGDFLGPKTRIAEIFN